jgi:predicted Zn-dependent peptidase
MKQFVLPNGIRCLLNDTDCSCQQSVTIIIMFKVGSRDEPDDYHGLTHFAEHMFFKGTSRRPKAKMISAEIDRHGGYMNAVTDYDVTYYYIKIDYRYFETALDVLSDILFNALFRQSDINSEKEVIVNELKMYKNDPARYANLLLGEVMFQGTTHEHDIGGDVDIIRSATREKFLNFVNYFYRPDNTIISIAGRIPGNSKSIVTLIKKYFNQNFNYLANENKNGLNKNGFKPRELFPNFLSIQKKDRFKYHVKPDIDGSYLAVGFPSFKYLCRDYFTMLMICCILGKGMSSRLFIEVREKRGLAYRVGCNINGYEDMGAFIISCATHGKDIRKTFQVIWSELINLKKSVTQEEVSIAHDHLIGELHLQKESTVYLAREAAYQELFFGKVMSIENVEKAIKKVTLADIKRMSGRIFKKSLLNAVVISNKSINLK